MSNKFKAGDFTSGKMNEIFKKAYSIDEFVEHPVVISHKQLGEFALISKDCFKSMVLGFLCENTEHSLTELYNMSDSDIFELVFILNINNPLPEDYYYAFYFCFTNGVD